MHYWRIPVPEMWTDILQKIKAAGFTGFTFYSNWGYHAFNSTSLDFETGAHDIGRFFELAPEIGLYIVFRPGPYINAEAKADGFPLWLCTGAYGALRDNGSAYTEAYTPYLNAFAEAAKPYLILNGGNGILYQIENEYADQWIGDPVDKVPDLNASAYMQNMENLARAAGINIPLDFNNPNATPSPGPTSLPLVPKATLTLAVSIATFLAGLAILASALALTDHTCRIKSSTTTATSYLSESRLSPTSCPNFRAAATILGAVENIGPDFPNIFYRHNIAERGTAFNLYMMYGGTNWGSFATPVVATSYDYSASISEDRILWDKYSETKLLALFT
ncbi:hypothetical protein MMC08_008017 [Hypocenomyce scalaris]|nr:hypothetical protein [Hypocenomyce scalaris]